MVQIDYEKAGKTAARIIERFGSTGQVIRKTQDDYDPATSSTEEKSDKIQSVKMARLDYKIYEVDGSRIKSGDWKMMIANKISPPEVGDRIEFCGESGTVVDCIPFSPAGKVVYYQVQVRR